MIRHLKILLLVMAVIGLMAGAAFAGTVGQSYAGANVVGGALNNVATELFPSTGYTPAANSLPIFYAPGVLLVSGDLVTLTFSNVAVKDAGFRLCALSAAANEVATFLGTANTTSGISSLLFRMTANLTTTDAGLYLGDTSGACNLKTAEYGAGGSNKLDPIFTQLTAGQSATIAVSATTSSGTSIPGATATANTLYTVANQFALAAPTALSNYIDFASALKKILDASGAANTRSTGNALAATNTEPTTYKLTPVAGDLLELTLSGSMSGVNNICHGVATCSASAASGNKYTINTSASTAALNLDLTTSGGGLANVNVPITFEFDGTTALSARDYTLTGYLKFVSTSELSRTLLAATTYFSLKLNATQWYIPLIKYGTGVETYIKAQSKNTSTGANGISIQVLCKDGSVVTVTPATSTVTPGTPWSITGTDIGTLVTAAGKTVDGAAGFAAIITLNAPPADTFGYANTIDSAGQWKRIPMKVYGGTIVE